MSEPGGLEPGGLGGMLGESSIAPPRAPPSVAPAAEDAARCVSLKPDWSKGHSRRGAAHFTAFTRDGDGVFL